MKALRRAGVQEMSDDRILGNGKFAEQIIKEAATKVKISIAGKGADSENSWIINR